MLLLWFVDGWLVRCPASARASCPQRAPRHIRSDHRNLLVLCFRHGRVIESRVNRRKCVVVVVRRCFAGSASALPCKRESFVFGRRAPRCTSSNQRDPMRLYIESKRSSCISPEMRRCCGASMVRGCLLVCWCAASLFLAAVIRAPPMSTLRILKSSGYSGVPLSISKNGRTPSKPLN
jgi:hypothetical protein